MMAGAATGTPNYSSGDLERERIAWMNAWKEGFTQAQQQAQEAANEQARLQADALLMAQNQATAKAKAEQVLCGVVKVDCSRCRCQLKSIQLYFINFIHRVRSGLVPSCELSLLARCTHLLFISNPKPQP